MSVANLKSVIFLLIFVTSVQPEEATRRTCSQSLMVALRAIFEQNANEVCVSFLLFRNSRIFLVFSDLFQTMADLKAVLAPIFEELMDERVSFTTSKE